MTKTIAIILLLTAYGASGSTQDVNAIANAIYRAEGGTATEYPYGIRSIDTHGDKVYARKICLNSIRNAEKRWIKAGKPEDFIVFIGRRYSPPNINPNWVKLVKYFIKKEGNTKK
jgi:hypothetical protein